MEQPQSIRFFIVEMMDTRAVAPYWVPVWPHDLYTNEAAAESDKTRRESVPGNAEWLKHKVTELVRKTN